MSDFLFMNNNKAIIKILSNSSFKYDKSRNIVVIIAVFLTTLLICSVFSIGGSYISSYQLQQQQILGTTGQATLNAPTETQYEILKQSDSIAIVGLRTDIITPSFVTAGFDTNGTNLYYGFRYYNSEEWANHRIPVLNDVVGHYPEQKDEIMIPTWVLNKMGITSPELGMQLSFRYKADTTQNTQEKVFSLCGWFDEYDYVKDGTVAYLLISEAFYANEMIDLWNNENTTADITFTPTNDIQSIASMLEQSLGLSANQLLSINPDVLDGNNNLSIIGICIVLGIGIMLCGYLLIYNVFYISVSNDVRFYGQLRTIGTTSKQIRRIVYWQARKIALIGIVCGLSMSALLSYFLVPIVLRTLTEATSGITIVYHPVIYIGASVFSLITVAVSVLKPARIAEKSSPMGAYRYYDVKISTKKPFVNHKFSPAYMAIKNLGRSKSKTVLVVLSIFLGVTSCMIVSSLVSSMNTDNFISNTLKSDIELTNQTLALGHSGEQQQIFDEDFFNKLGVINGISSIDVQREQTIIPTYSNNMFYPYIENKYAEKGITVPDSNYYKEHPNLFYTQLVSIDPDNLREIFDKNGWELEAFRNGDFALLVSNKPDLFPTDMVIDFQLGHIQQYEAVPDGEIKHLNIGGFLPSSYYGGLRTDAPYIFVSNQTMEKIAPNAYISKIDINTNPSDTKAVISSIKALCSNLKISMVSRMELSNGLKNAKMTLYALGGGIAMVLAFIGIINFINIMFTNITARKHELSMLESIGMTKKQCRRMLQMEGLWYALISMALILTIGNACLFLVYQAFKGTVEYAVFSYPIFPLILLVVLLSMVCWNIPSYFLNKTSKKPVVERLKEN